MLAVLILASCPGPVQPEHAPAPVGAVAPTRTAGDPRDAGKRTIEAYHRLERFENCNDTLTSDLLDLVRELQALDIDAARPWFAPGFAGQPLFPPGGRTERFGTHYQVRRTAGEGTASVDASAWLSSWKASLGSWTSIEDLSVAVTSARFDGLLCLGGTAALELSIQGHDRSSRPTQVLARVEVDVDSDLGRYRLERLRLSATETLVADREVFAEVTAAAGVRFVMSDVPVMTRLHMGWQGVAAADVDGDGDVDIFVPSVETNFLYLNDGKGSFVDAAKAWHVESPEGGTGPLFFDMDNDGDQDLLLCFVLGPGIRLFRNTGSGFQDVSASSGVAIEAHAYSACTADIDRDGLLDVYVACYNAYGMVAPDSWHDARNGTPNLLLRNLGGGRFEECAPPRGVDDGRWSYAAAFADFDDDGDPDLYVANDHGSNALFVNDGEGRFTDRAREFGVDDAGQGMGVDWGDADGDGRPDLYVMNIASSTGRRLIDRLRAGDSLPGPPADVAALVAGNGLYLNRGSGFERAPVEDGAAGGGWAWCGRFLDYDNDGALDIYVVNGFISGRKRNESDWFYWSHLLRSTPGVPELVAVEPLGDAYLEDQFGRVFGAGRSFAGFQRNRLFLNLGDGRFRDVSGVSGCDSPGDGRGMVPVDVDRDGDLDLFVHNLQGDRHQIFENRIGTRRSWVMLELCGTRSNRDAIGARIEIEAGDRKLVRWIGGGSGFVSSGDRRLHVGLGEGDRVDRIHIRWPGGRSETHGPFPARHAYRIIEGQVPEVIVP